MLRPNKRFISGASFFGLVFALSLWAQQQPPAQSNQGGKDETGAVFRSDTRIVVLHVTVVDKNGHLVTNLTKDQFQIFENSQPQQIRSFKREDVPVSLGLVVDNSGSMRDKRSKVESACLTLVKASNPQDEVFVVNFNDEAFLDNPKGKNFTNDIKEMEEALTRIDSRGGTAMRDAVRMSIDHLKEKAKKDKRVLVVVTDGNDNASLVSLETLVKAAQQSEVLLYTIGLLGDEERREAKRAQRALNALAEATGGQSYFPKDSADVERIAHQVAKDVRNQYTIVYSPSNQKLDGSYRQIKVVANASGKPNVRTRSGYYATPDGVNNTTSNSKPSGE